MGRVTNVAKTDLVLTRYSLERPLYRLAISEHASHFLLKGALLFDLWLDVPHRPTRDADPLDGLTKTRYVLAHPGHSRTRKKDSGQWIPNITPSSFLRLPTFTVSENPMDQRLFLRILRGLPLPLFI